MADVRIEIDQDLCIGAGQCEALAPDAILLGDDGIARPSGDGLLPEAVAGEIVRTCPSGAFRIVEG